MVRDNTHQLDLTGPKLSVNVTGRLKRFAQIGFFGRDLYYVNIKILPKHNM